MMEKSVLALMLLAVVISGCVATTFVTPFPIITSSEIIDIPSVGEVAEVEGVIVKCCGLSLLERTLHVVI